MASQGVGNFAEAVTKSGELQSQLNSLITATALQNNGLQQRLTGSVFNNNTELLFNTPQLRTFPFTFTLSPRSKVEATRVMQIIRFFKQAMSVKRSATTLLLKTPRTFAISYLTYDKNKKTLIQHPFLTRFKECALTSFTVDYTPDSNYMTYWSDDPKKRSMTSYRLTLQFQELEPIFDDEYGNESSEDLINVGF